MKLFLQPFLFVALAGICFSAFGQVKYAAELKKLSGVKAELIGLRKKVLYDSLMQDSISVENTDSIAGGYLKGAVRKKMNDAANSASLKIKQELSAELELPAEVPALHPFAEIEAAAGQAVWQGQQAFDHFSGQAEKLQAALSHFDDFKRKGKAIKELIGRRDSIRGRHISADFLVHTGFVRPLTGVPAIDLYPSAGVCLLNKITFYAGRTIRVAQPKGSFSGSRVAAGYMAKPGILFFLEGEQISYITEGIRVRNRHLLTGVQKSISLKGQLSSFIMAGLDWGPQLPDDGYAERYRVRAGLEYKFSKKPVKQEPLTR